MNLSKNVSKRVRPLLGTFVEVTLFGESNFNPIITAAFDMAGELEKIFNRHNPDSEICRYNRFPDSVNFHTSGPFKFVLETALEIFNVSEGAFTPYLTNSLNLDLNGITKGYIVDQMVEFMLSYTPALAGIVNAGGDLRYFNIESRTADIRMNAGSNPITRQIKICKDAVASSSLNTATNDKRSSTVYLQQLRHGLSVDDTVSVVAHNCIYADALTKVALFADFEIVQKCALASEAQVFIFDINGELKEMFNDHEA